MYVSFVKGYLDWSHPVRCSWIWSQTIPCLAHPGLRLSRSASSDVPNSVALQRTCTLNARHFSKRRPEYTKRSNHHGKRAFVCSWFHYVPLHSFLTARSRVSRGQGACGADQTPGNGRQDIWEASLKGKCERVDLHGFFLVLRSSKRSSARNSKIGSDSMWKILSHDSRYSWYNQMKNAVPCFTQNPGNTCQNFQNWWIWYEPTTTDPKSILKGHGAMVTTPPQMRKARKVSEAVGARPPWRLCLPGEKHLLSRSLQCSQRESVSTSNPLDPAHTEKAFGHSHNSRTFEWSEYQLCSLVASWGRASAHCKAPSKTKSKASRWRCGKPWLHTDWHSGV